MGIQLLYAPSHPPCTSYCNGEWYQKKGVTEDPWRTEARRAKRGFRHGELNPGLLGTSLTIESEIS